MITQIKEYQWEKYRAQYRKWYKNHFGVTRCKITTPNDTIQLISYIQANILTSMPTKGQIEIIKKNNYTFKINYEVNCK